MIFEGFSGLRELTEVKLVSYGRAVNFTLSGHVFSAVGVPSESVARGRSSHALCIMATVPVAATVQVILTQILHYQN